MKSGWPLILGWVRVSYGILTPCHVHNVDQVLPIRWLKENPNFENVTVEDVFVPFGPREGVGSSA